jgi:hypothetical protein
MSKHTRLEDIRDRSRYSELPHDAGVALWREQYEQSIQSGTPPPDLPHDVQQALIRSAHQAQGQAMIYILSWPFRQLARLLLAPWRRANEGAST